MNSLIHADIFFFISSIGFVLFFILLFIAIIYLISLLKSINKMAQKVEANIESISDEAKEMVLDFRDSPVMSFLFGGKRRKSSKSK